MKSSVLLALLAVLPAVAVAGEQTDEAKSAAELVRSRFVGQWAYVPVTFVPGPMVTTYAASTTGLGQWKVNLDLATPRSLGLKTNGLTYTAALQRFDAEIAILGTLGIRGHAQGQATVPNDLASAFGVPASGTTGGGGGLLLRLIGSNRLALSVTADYAALEQSAISPALSLSQSLQQFKLSALRSTQSTQSLVTGASFALAFCDWAGLVAEAAWEGQRLKSVGDLIDHHDTLGFLDLAGALSFNTWRQALPVGATAFFREQIPLGGTPFLAVRQYGAGIFYTGRPYVDLGLELLVSQQQRTFGSILRSVSQAYLAPRIQIYF